MASPPKKFAATDAQKSVRDLFIVLVAVALAWGTEQGVPALEEMGWFPPVFVALIAAVISAIRRWWVDTRPEQTLSDAGK